MELEKLQMALEMQPNRLLLKNMEIKQGSVLKIQGE